MVTNQKISELDYCYVSWELLQELEKNAFSRNECIRAFKKESNDRQSLITSVVALILPIILLGSIVFSNRAASLMYGSTGTTENIWTRVVGLLMLSAFLFLIVYMLSKELSKYKAFRPIKKLINQDLEANLRLEVDAIDQRASKIVNDSILKDSKIPEKFLSSEFLLVIIKYMESGQASFIKEAVYALRLDLKNTGYYANIFPKETLLQLEKKYLLNRNDNLAQKIELAEKND